VIGSFLVLIKIEQDVAAFEQFCEVGARRLTEDWGLDPAFAAEDFAAMLVGRRKDGTPLDLRPIGVPKHAVPVSLNDFAYKDDPTGRRCPLGAHIRKMNPRSPGSESHVIMRRGIPYREDGTQGLLFTCYQSSLADGFVHLQSLWGDGPFSSDQRAMDRPNHDAIAAQVENPPPGQTIADTIDWGERKAAHPEVPDAGADPLIGLPIRRGQGGFEIRRPAPLGGSTAVPLPLRSHWVTYRDGNYFFSPSRSTMEQWFG
jgi:hypothetical protein